MSTHRGRRKFRKSRFPTPPSDAPRYPPGKQIYGPLLHREEEKLKFIAKNMPGLVKNLDDLRRQQADSLEPDPAIERRIAERERVLHEDQRAANKSHARCRRLRALLGEGGAS